MLDELLCVIRLIEGADSPEKENLTVQSRRVDFKLPEGSKMASPGNDSQGTTLCLSNYYPDQCCAQL